MIFTIFQVVEPTFCVDPQAPIQYTGQINALDLEDAYTQSQGDQLHWSARSTSVGDFIIAPDGKVYIVQAIGFQLLTP